MRRQQQHITCGAVGGVFIAMLADVLIQWLETRESGECFSWENYDGKRTIKSGIIGGIAGGALGYAYHKYKVCDEARFPFDPDEYLLKLLALEHINSNPEVYKSVALCMQNVKARLAELFKHQLVSGPENTGSYRKRTINISNYDLDIILPMRRDSYSSLKEMYEHVFNTLGQAFGNNVIVRKQTKAIGLIFSVDGYDIYFDVVPGREIGNYLEDHELNLYVRPEWLWERGGSFKTNVNDQKNFTVNQPEARKVIRILKIYSDRNNLQIPTTIIEHCVINALSDHIFGVYKSVIENLLNCMDYLVTKLNHAKIIDHANTNNNLNDKISDWNKFLIVNRLRKDIIAIENNPRFLKEMFEL